MCRVGLGVALLLAVPVSAHAEDPLWSVRATASGSYLVDYKDDGDAVDGQGSGSWLWELKALADGIEVDTSLAIFRMTVTEESDIVAGGTTPSCRPPAGFTLDWVRDSRVGLFLSGSRGFRVTHPFFDRLLGCHVGAHGMTLYDGASPADTRIPRGAFRPRRDRVFSRSWTQEIALPEGHEGGPPHAFLSTGTLTIRLKRLGPRAAKRLRTRLRAVPRS